jgi:hypothetical protein
VDGTGYRKLTLSAGSSNGTFTAGDAFRISFSHAGDKGSDGANGSGTFPRSSTDNAIPRFDGTAGSIVQNSGVTIDDSNNVAGVATIELGHATDTTLSRSAAGVVAVEGIDLLKKNGNQTLTGGFTCTSLDQGTKSSGMFTPDMLTGPVQHYTNGGAHTLAPPTGHGSVVMDMTNNASAGAVTTSGFTKVTGDALTTTNGNKFRFFITVGNGGSHLHKQALQ